LNEARSCYLRSVYFLSSPEERSSHFMEAVLKFQSYIGDDFNLKTIMGAGTEPLPDFNEFLELLIKKIESVGNKFTSYLKREAVMLSGGMEAFTDFAHQDGKNHPQVYIDLINALKEKNDLPAMLKEAERGLEEISLDITLRAEIGELKAFVGVAMSDLQIEMEGWSEAFNSYPSIVYLLSLLKVAEKMNCIKEVSDKAIKRALSFSDSNFHFPLYIITGRYKKLARLLSEFSESDRNCANKSLSVGIVFFLKLLSGEKSNCVIINSLWETIPNNMLGFMYLDKEGLNAFNDRMKKVFDEIELSESEKKYYMKLCSEFTGKFVDSIVGAKERWRYKDAAKHLIANSEMLTRNQLDGNLFIEKYRKKYHRHVAFKREIESVIKAASR
jgi:tetratricopeptide (TPR) repeat protein